VTTNPIWRQREDALVWGAPLVVIPALAFVPLLVSFLFDPAFHHARVVGVILLPLLAIAEVSGLSRIARCFAREFDVLSVLAGGVVVILVVIAMCSGVMLAMIVSRL
jgi:hypothetical protein